MFPFTIIVTDKINVEIRYSYQVTVKFNMKILTSVYPLFWVIDKLLRIILVDIGENSSVNPPDLHFRVRS